MKKPIIIWLFLVLIVCGFSKKPAHDFHSALAEIDYNPKTKNFEISARFFIDDLEKKLSQSANRKIRLDTEKQPDSLLAAFLAQNLRLYVANKPCSQIWHGFQAKDQTLWLYAQAYLPNPNAGLSLEFGALTDVFSDQANIAHISIDEKKRSLLFTKNTNRQSF